jgi:hypothetical protein
MQRRVASAAQQDTPLKKSSPVDNKAGMGLKGI